MPRIVLGIAGTITVVLSFFGTAVSSGVAEAKHSFKLTILSNGVMEIHGKKQKINTDTVLRYTWRQRAAERDLNFESALIKSEADGIPLMNIFMSRAKLIDTQAGKVDEVLFDNASEKLKKMLRDSFDVPVCKLQVDENGKEVKREIVANPGAKDLLDHGVIADARLFHPPFMRAQDAWSAATELSMGYGGFAKGDLRYQKDVARNDIQTVKVSGILTNDLHIPAGQAAGKVVTFKNARFVCSGEKTYDLGQREWVAGKLVTDVSFEMTEGGKPVGSVKGTRIAILEKPLAKK